MIWARVMEEGRMEGRGGTEEGGREGARERRRRRCGPEGWMKEEGRERGTDENGRHDCII